MCGKKAESSRHDAPPVCSGDDLVMRRDWKAEAHQIHPDALPSKWKPRT